MRHLPRFISGLKPELFQDLEWDAIRDHDPLWIYDVAEAMGFQTGYIEDYDYDEANGAHSGIVCYFCVECNTMNLTFLCVHSSL